MSPCRPGILAALALAATLGACASEYEGVDLFPLYRDVGDEQAGEFFWLLPPIWSSWDDQGSLSWSLPFHLHRVAGEHSQLTLVPLVPLWYRNRSVDADVTAFFPLWNRTVTGVRREHTVALLLAKWTAHDDEPGLQGLSISPLFAWRARPHGRILDFVTTDDFLTGKRGPGALLNLLSIDTSQPRFGAQDGDALDIDFLAAGGGIVQLFHHGDSGSHDDTRFLTLFASEPLSLFRWRRPHEGAPGEAQRSLQFFPLWLDFEDAGSRFFSAWPVYGFAQADSRVTRRYFAWPLLTVSSEGETGRDGFAAIFRLFGSETERGIDETWLWPLFDVKRAERGHDWNVLFGLIGHGENEQRSVLRILWIPFESEKDAAGSGDQSSPAPAETAE
jgi:hypothetical protein